MLENRATALKIDQQKCISIARLIGSTVSAKTMFAFPSVRDIYYYFTFNSITPFAIISDSQHIQISFANRFVGMSKEIKLANRWKLRDQYYTNQTHILHHSDQSYRMPFDLSLIRIAKIDYQRLKLTKFA